MSVLDIVVFLFPVIPIGVAALVSRTFLGFDVGGDGRAYGRAHPAAIVAADLRADRRSDDTAELVG
jgi:hypothetical protein